MHNKSIDFFTVQTSICEHYFVKISEWAGNGFRHYRVKTFSSPCPQLLVVLVDIRFTEAYHAKLPCHPSRSAPGVWATTVRWCGHSSHDSLLACSINRHLLLYPIIVSMLSEVAIREVYKFHRWPQHLELFVHLASTTIDKGHPEQVIAWTNETLEWLTRWNSLSFSLARRPQQPLKELLCLCQSHKVTWRCVQFRPCNGLIHLSTFPCWRLQTRQQWRMVAAEKEDWTNHEI